MVNTVFLHPDLGIGGAERAVIDAALALKARGHQVQFVTAHHDPNHCFEETKDGTVKVTAVGDWLPRSLFGKFYAFCAYTRMIYAALYLVIFSCINFDVIFCDQISACIPFLRLFSRAKIIFYCHFPDQLLTQRKSLLKKIYRTPIDWFEEKTTGMAHCVLVNSKFTAGVFKETFTSLGHIVPEILYPIPDFSKLDQPVEKPTQDLMPTDAEVTFLSINRYERKKNLGLAIKALECLKQEIGLKGIYLVMAGGYDDRVTENREHNKELCEMAETLQLQDHIKFVRSFSDSQKRTLLKHSTCLLYTPDREHFGIVPIESMYMKCPVIAVKSGGPLETVESGKTGFLCDPNPSDFALAMQRIVEEKNLCKELGVTGYNRVTSKFSFAAFTSQLNQIVDNLCH